MWTLLVGLCALACPLSMGVMMLFMHRRSAPSSSASSDPIGRGRRPVAFRSGEKEPDGS